MSYQNYTDTYTNGKTLKRRREYVFWGKVKETWITVYEELINLLILIVSRENVLSAMNILGLSVEILCLT